MHHRFRFRFLLPVVSAFALLAAAAFIGAGSGATSAQTPSPSADSSATATSSGGTATSGTPSASSTGVPSEVSQNADQWPLANADYSNTRSATGSSINASNVNKLGVAWTFKIPSGAAQFGSAATNPIISGNTVYLQDLSSNVYAFDLKSGDMKWKKDFNQPASGPNGPGVAYGKVFVALNDGSIVALDANNGNQLWNTKLARSSSEGITIQVTPYDNQLYVSTVPGTGQSFYKGGDTGVLYGLDQATGNVLWHFDTVASDRWGNANINSGGGTWYPPAIDTQTGQSFWGIGNPAPFPGTKDFPNGSSRPGQNLYTDSIVSLAPETTAGVQPSGTPSSTTRCERHRDDAERIEQRHAVIERHRDDAERVEQRHAVFERHRDDAERVEQRYAVFERAGRPGQRDRRADDRHAVRIGLRHADSGRDAGFAELQRALDRGWRWSRRSAAAGLIEQQHQRHPAAGQRGDAGVVQAGEAARPV